MAARAIKLRDVMLPDVTALASRGLIDGRRLKQLRGGTGYRNASVVLQLLAAMVRERWSDIASRALITEAELTEAEALGDNLSDAVDRREQASAVTTQATRERTRAFTLFARAYDEVRRAVSYLRWHEGDVDTLVPSLYTGRGGRGKGDAATGKTPAAPTPASVAPVGDSHHATPAPTPVVIPGQPGGSPFIS